MSWDRKAERKERFNKKLNSKSKTKNKSHRKERTKYKEDFNILSNAKNLATSGVGTFAIAAAMCSKKIENLYYSDLFFNHHLNPTMLKKVNHIKFKFER